MERVGIVRVHLVVDVQEQRADVTCVGVGVALQVHRRDSSIQLTTSGALVPVASMVCRVLASACQPRLYGGGPGHRVLITTLALMATNSVSVRTLDGLHLAGTLVRPQKPTPSAVVLVHGGGVTREEGGFFTRLAGGLADAGITSLRFDLRGHGESEGRQEELTLSTILNDIRVMLAHVHKATQAEQITLLGASFGGGICAYYAAKRPSEVTRLVLFNPQLDYKRRTIDSRPHWTDDVISEEAAQELNERGALQFTPTLRHGRPFSTRCFGLIPMKHSGRFKHQRSSCTARLTRSFRTSPRALLSSISRHRLSSCPLRARSTVSLSTMTRNT